MNIHKSQRKNWWQSVTDVFRFNKNRLTRFKHKAASDWSNGIFETFGWWSGLLNLWTKSEFKVKTRTASSLFMAHQLASDQSKSNRESLKERSKMINPSYNITFRRRFKPGIIIDGPPPWGITYLTSWRNPGGRGLLSGLVPPGNGAPRKPGGPQSSPTWGGGTDLWPRTLSTARGTRRCNIVGCDDCSAIRLVRRVESQVCMHFSVEGPRKRVLTMPVTA